MLLPQLKVDVESNMLTLEIFKRKLQQTSTSNVIVKTKQQFMQFIRQHSTSSMKPSWLVVVTETTSSGAKNLENDWRLQTVLILQSLPVQWHQMPRWLPMHLDMIGQEDVKDQVILVLVFTFHLF